MDDKTVVTPEEVEKELKEAMHFGFELAEAIDKAGADGKIDVADIGYLMAPMIAIGPAISGLGKLKNIDDLSPARLAGLVEWAKADLDLADDNLEEKVEAVFEMVVRLYGVVMLFVKKEAPVQA